MTTGPSPSAPPPATPLGRAAAFLARLRQRRGVRALTEFGWVLVVILAIGAFQARNHLSAGTALELTLPALDGAPVSLASLRGKPAMLVFWAPWCGVCKAQADNVGRVRRLAGGGATVLTVAASFEDLAEVRASSAAYDGVPVLLADDETVRAFRVDAFPTVYFLDADGRVKRSAAGYTTTISMLLRLWL